MKQHFVVIIASLIRETSSVNPYWYWYSTQEEIETYKNGVVPTLACSLGFYRDFGDRSTRRHGGIGIEGCIPCPPGRYGSSVHLQTSYCTGACPIGTYNDKSGGTSKSDCKPCPIGTFGDSEGLTTRECSGFCSGLNTVKTKYYGENGGLTSRSACRKCPEGFLDPSGQCKNMNSILERYLGDWYDENLK